MPKMFGDSTLENGLNLTPSLPFENCKENAHRDIG